MTIRNRDELSILAVAILLAPLALASAPTLAQGHGHPTRGPAAMGHGHPGPGHEGAPRGAHGPGTHMMALHHLLSRLDLSDDQRDEIHALVDAGRENDRPLHADLGERREALHQALRAEELDEAAIRSAVMATAEIEAELAVRAARRLAEVREVLTPEQRERATELLERGREWRERRREEARGGR